LAAAEKAFKNGYHDADQLRGIMTKTIADEELANIQYVSCADADSLDELHGPIRRGLLSLAVFIGKTRLIDNLVIGD
jgi:pantoate--beta-alanine ligase